MLPLRGRHGTRRPPLSYYSDWMVHRYAPYNLYGSGGGLGFGSVNEVSTWSRQALSM